MGKGNPENTFCETRKQETCYHEWETQFMCVAEEILFFFRLSSFYSLIFCGTIQNADFWEMCLRYCEPVGKVLLKVIIFTFLPLNSVRHDPYRTLLPGQRPHGRPGASGWPTRRWLGRPPTAG